MVTINAMAKELARRRNKQKEIKKSSTQMMSEKENNKTVNDRNRDIVDPMHYISTYTHTVNNFHIFSVALSVFVFSLYSTFFLVSPFYCLSRLMCAMVFKE